MTLYFGHLEPDGYVVEQKDFKGISEIPSQYKNYYCDGIFYWDSELKVFEYFQESLIKELLNPGSNLKEVPVKDPEIIRDLLENIEHKIKLLKPIKLKTEKK